MSSKNLVFKFECNCCNKELYGQLDVKYCAYCGDEIVPKLPIEIYIAKEAKSADVSNVLK